LGDPFFDNINAVGDSGLNVFLQILLVTFMCMGVIMMLNLLVAMMAETFQRVRETALEEVVC